MILLRVASLQTSMAQNVPWPRALLRIWGYWVYVRGRSETINECAAHNVKGVINLQAPPQNKHSLHWQDWSQDPSRSYEAGPQMNNERPHNRTINAFKASGAELWHLWGISHVPAVRTDPVEEPSRSASPPPEGSLFGSHSAPLIRTDSLRGRPSTCWRFCRAEVHRVMWFKRSLYLCNSSVLILKSSLKMSYNQHLHFEAFILCLLALRSSTGTSKKITISWKRSIFFHLFHHLNFFWCINQINY